MRILNIALWSGFLSLIALGTASAQVQLSIADGRVSLVAKDATVRQILAEWARVGQTRIVNGERVPGGPITIELHDVSEARALDTILRTVSGYMAAPRESPIAHASMFDRIVVLPTSAAPAAAAPAARTTPAPSPVFPQPQGFPPAPYPTPANADEENEAGQQRGPVFNPFPPPQVGGQPPMPNPMVPAQGPLTLPQPGGATGPTSPYSGVSTPGMIVQPPQQPATQPVIPGQPRRPGGSDR